MIVSCHQPNYLPYLGFFDKMKKSDVFVLYDAVQFTDANYQHRNRIRTNQGWMWLTMPVERHKIPINEILVKKDSIMSKQPWQQYHWNVIEATYKKTPYFKNYADELKEIYVGKPYTHMAELNIALITFLAKAGNISTPMKRLSEMGVSSDDAAERLALATEKLGGDTYLSGSSGGSKYELNTEEFSKRNIKLAFQEFHHPEYPQYHTRYDGKFEKYMGAIDALFNTGSLLV
jgi:hypothetical protein